GRRQRPNAYHPRPHPAVKFHGGSWTPNAPSSARPSRHYAVDRSHAAQPPPSIGTPAGRPPSLSRIDSLPLLLLTAIDGTTSSRRKSSESRKFSV
ncbi:hypothetical protein U9M48_020325, partial [Paspalum notatum var. saurae]